MRGTKLGVSGPKWCNSSLFSHRGRGEQRKERDRGKKRERQRQALKNLFFLFLAMAQFFFSFFLCVDFFLCIWVVFSQHDPDLHVSCSLNRRGRRFCPQPNTRAFPSRPQLFQETLWVLCIHPCCQTQRHCGAANTPGVFGTPLWCLSHCRHAEDFVACYIFVQSEFSLSPSFFLTHSFCVLGEDSLLLKDSTLFTKESQCHPGDSHNPLVMTLKDHLKMICF